MDIVQIDDTIADDDRPSSPKKARLENPQPSTSNSDAKRTCKVNNEWFLIPKYKCFVRKSDTIIVCQSCPVKKNELDVSYHGISALDKHLKTEKHKNGLKKVSGHGKILDDFVVTGVEWKRLRAAEGTLSYHIIKQRQSFKSVDDLTDVIVLICGDSKIAKSIQCGRTKAEKIITSVLAPHSVDLIVDDLVRCFFYSISTDASNHKAIKVFPLLVQYFDPFKGGIQIKILGVVNLDNEKSETVSEMMIGLITEALSKKLSEEEIQEILRKISAFSGDNCSTNFGSQARRGENNVFYRLKDMLDNPELVGVGCPMHVSHNAAKKGLGMLSFNIDTLAHSLHSQFDKQTIPTAKLQLKCAEHNVEFMTLLTHSHTRVIGTKKVAERLLHLHDPLRDYFDDTTSKVPPSISKFYKSKFAKCYLLLIIAFNKSMEESTLKLETRGNSVLETRKYMKEIVTKLQNRVNLNFLPLDIVKEIDVLLENGAVTQSEVNKFKSESVKMHTSALNYMKLWYQNYLEFEIFDYLDLIIGENRKLNFTYEDISKSIPYLESKSVKIDDSKLVDELAYVMEYVKTIKNHTEWNSLQTHEKWSKMICSAKSVSCLQEFLKICQYVFSLFAHNADAERVFIIEGQWTEDRNRLLIENVCGIAQVDFNFQMTSLKFYNYLMNNEKLLKQIGGNEKYTKKD